jgi:hypothetical protein
MEKEIQAREINPGLRIPGSNRIGAGKAAGTELGLVLLGGAVCPSRRPKGSAGGGTRTSARGWGAVCLEEDFTRAVRCSALRFQGGHARWAIFGKGEKARWWERACCPTRFWPGTTWKFWGGAHAVVPWWGAPRWNARQGRRRDLGARVVLLLIGGPSVCIIGLVEREKAY